MIVGFDLDLTLIDSRPGIGKSMSALAAETGVAIDVDLVLSRIGPKLEWELANWYPESDVPQMAARYRELYWDFCIGDGSVLLEGARESVDAVHGRDGRVLVVTAKSEPLARRCLESVGITADVVVGWVHGDEKRESLEAHGAQVYVGDVIADMKAGVDTGALAVGVTTGTNDERELRDAGATAVFSTLRDFPGWLASLT